MEKRKTSAQRRTLNPSYQETLRFESDFRGCVLQVTVWGDFGKLDKKSFMGIAQIVLDDVSMSAGAPLVGWYKLYSIASVIADFSAIASVAEIGAADSAYNLQTS